MLEGNISQQEEHLTMHDALKNVTSIFDGQQTKSSLRVATSFEVLTLRDLARENKFRFSCEFSRMTNWDLSTTITATSIHRRQVD